MIHRTKTSGFRLLLSVLGLLCLIGIVGCQDETETTGEKTAAVEPDRDVPEMDAFLDTFRNVFVAYADDDLATVRDSAAALAAAAEKLVAAELPEFHTDVSEEFKHCQASFAEAIDKFETAAAGTDDEALAVAVDNVRAEFLEMMTLLTPAIDELDHFHELLRPLWHEATPNQDYATIKASMPDLVGRMDSLMTAELPPKYGYMKAEFNARRDSLRIAVDDLAKACKDGTEAEIEEKMITMHEAYHDLVDCLE